MTGSLNPPRKVPVVPWWWWYYPTTTR